MSESTNVDTDRDGKTDASVEPMTRTAKADAPSADIYEEADDTSKKLASLPRGALCEDRQGTGDVARDAVQYNDCTALVQVIDLAV
jgi:hypothetical protein